MPWIIGIDEAGYGPNLGPLVMTSVALWIPEPAVKSSVWDLLESAVRNHAADNDDRLFVADSKLVYSHNGGLGQLERGVLALLTNTAGQRPGTLDELVLQLSGQSHEGLAREHWYRGDTPLPQAASGGEITADSCRLGDCCETREIRQGPVFSVFVCPSQFNTLVEKWRSKGVVLAEALGMLLRENVRALSASSALSFTIDKHGGRNHYSAMLQDVFRESYIVCREEHAARSVYAIHGQDIEITFQPRADVEHLCVAWASMVSKYVREICMLEFNRYWEEQVPGIKPTAGYPADAVRFYEAIRPAARRLGLEESTIWRCR